MNRRNGAVRIFLYNWPVYVASWAFGLAMVLSPRFVDARFSGAAIGAAGVAFVWSLASLLVSQYVYGVSSLVSGQWVTALLGTPARAWATVHAGLDAEIELDGVMSGACVARLDIFEPRIMTSPSIARARATTPLSRAASPCSPTALALPNEACDTIVVAFTAHEIRNRSARETFFHELRRSLCPGGRVLLVEHLRDLPNFLAFGPGYLHFVPRREWLRLASHASFAVASETRVTPWVTAVVLEKPR